MNPFKISVLSSAFSLSVREIPRLARLSGFDGLEFDVLSPQIDLTQLSGTGLREFRHLLQSENQQLASLRADIGAKGFGRGADIDQAVARLDRAMQTARQLTAPTLSVDLGPLPPSSRPAKPKPKVTPEMAGLILLPSKNEIESEPTAPASAPDPALVDQLRRALGVVGELADRYRVLLAFRSDLSGFASLSETIHNVNCPWFGIDLDPVAMLKDDWSSDEIFSSLGTMIHHLRARDALRGSDRRTKPMPIGQGSTDWRELGSLLDHAGYHGWITIDPQELNDRPNGAQIGLKHLRARPSL